MQSLCKTLLVFFLLCALPTVGLAEPEERQLAPIEYRDALKGKVIGQTIGDVAAGVWTYYWPGNNNVRLRVEYEDVEAVTRKVRSGFKPENQIISVTAYDVSGGLLETGLLPAQCLPSVQYRGCHWKQKTIQVKPASDPCKGCFSANYKCYVSDSSPSLRSMIEDRLKDAGLSISFSDEAGGAFVILTSFTDRKKFQDVYRVRVDVYGMPGWSHSKACSISISVEKLSIPLVSGRRDLLTAIASDDAITLGIGNYFKKIADDASKEGEAETRRIANQGRDGMSKSPGLFR